VHAPTIKLQITIRKKYVYPYINCNQLNNLNCFFNFTMKVRTRVQFKLVNCIRQLIFEWNCLIPVILCLTASCFYITVITFISISISISIITVIHILFPSPFNHTIHFTILDVWLVHQQLPFDCKFSQRFHFTSPSRDFTWRHIDISKLWLLQYLRPAFQPSRFIHIIHISHSYFRFIDVH
jgi:hypothetical protein